ncbi:MAG: alpha/beta hydrolase [Actinomycetota bacterium]|nr:alpha/beta hydrolase [Actinomycetota bacterium]
MSSWTTEDIVVNGVCMHVTRTGGDRPPVVLAHGFSDSGLCWTPVAAALEADYDLIMVDARGHGRLDAPESGYGPVEHAGDLHGVIAALGLHRPAVMGHSMGGATTYALAGLYPDVPGAILIEDAAPLRVAPPRASSGNDRLAGMHRWIQTLKRQTPEEMIAAQRTQTPTWSEAEFGPWAEAKLRLSLNVLNRSDAAPIDWHVVLPRITCPALLITADPEHGAGVTVERAAEMQTVVPQLRVAHVPGAGHNIRRDQFDRFLEVVRSFLAPWGATYQTTGT